MLMEIIIVSWKCLLNDNVFLNKNSNMFTIKWVQYRWKKQLVDNPLVLWSTMILVWKWASHFEIIDKSDNPNFSFDFNYNNTSSAWNKWMLCTWAKSENVKEMKKTKEPRSKDDINILSQLKKGLHFLIIISLVRHLELRKMFNYFWKFE
jgi:hypothetical protein